MQLTHDDFNKPEELRTPMHGIIAMSHELQDLLPPQTMATSAATIISGERILLIENE